MTTLNLSLAASVLGLVLLALRGLLKNRLPRWIFYAAWGLVLVRLLVPVALPSPASIYNLLASAQSAAEHPGQLTLVEDRGTVVDFPTLQEPPHTQDAPHGPAVTFVVAPSRISLTTILATVWLCGFGVLTGYSLLCYGYTRSRLGAGERLEASRVGRSWVPVVSCALFQGPVVCGVLRPIIVLPQGVEADTVRQVLAHECTHIRRLDNLWQGIATLALYLHWFNPLCWIFHRCFVADMEVSCDQAVCRSSDARTYAAALVELSQQNRNRLAGGFLAFGESFLAERVKAVLRQRRTSVRLVLLAGGVGLGLAIVFLTNPAVELPISSIESSPQSVPTAQPPPPSSTPPPVSPESDPASPPTPESALPIPESQPSAPTQPKKTMTYREDNPDFLQIDPAQVEAATLIDKENRLAVRIPTDPLWAVLEQLNALEPIAATGQPQSSGNLRLLQLRMADGSKYEYLLYNDSFAYGESYFSNGGALESLYSLLPSCGDLEQAGWGNVMPEWLGYMNPLRVSGITLRGAGQEVVLTTQDSQAAREDILWLTEQLCALNMVGPSQQHDPATQMIDDESLYIHMSFLSSQEQYFLRFYPIASMLRIETATFDYALAYRLTDGAVEKLTKAMKNRGLLE